MLKKLAFWKNYGEGKLAQAGEGLLATMYKLDPDGMTKADIENEREKFEKFSLEVEQYRSTYHREAAEAEAARTAYNTKMDQIRALEVAAEAHPDKAEKFQVAAGKLKAEAAELLATARTEIEEAELAKQDLDEVEAVQEEMAAFIKTLESNLSKTRATMERAKRAEARANKRAEHQERLAGLRKGCEGGSIGLNALQAQTEKAQQRADAANRRAELLGDAAKKTDAEYVDPDVAAILSGASCTPASTPDLPDAL